VRLLAGLCGGVFAYMATGYLTGYVPANFRRRLGERTPRPAGVSRQLWLHQAGAKVTPLQFWATSIGIGLAAFLVVLALTGTAVVALIPAVAVAGLPRAYYGRERRRRAGLQIRAWPDALRNLTGSLSATLSLHQSLVALTHTGPVPLRPVFERYHQLSGSLDQRAALEAIREELADPVSDRIIEVLILAVEQGPSIVIDILSDLARATTADLQLAERLETAQLEQRLNARAVFVLPYFMLIMLCARPGAFRDFYSGAGGIIVVALGGAMSLGGMAIINRLGRQPAEERVFGAPGQGR
jgi:tight adherence protein B